MNDHRCRHWKDSETTRKGRDKLVTSASLTGAQNATENPVQLPVTIPTRRAHAAFSTTSESRELKWSFQHYILGSLFYFPPNAARVL